MQDAGFSERECAGKIEDIARSLELALGQRSRVDADLAAAREERGTLDEAAVAESLTLALDGEVVSRPPFAGMYWTPDQQLAHLTVNGASLRTGDLYASGTVSGPERDQRGSFLELSWGGAQPLVTPSGREVSFLEDGDTVTIRGTFPTVSGGRAGFGEVVGRVLPARC
jgi:2-keto-4-pentenoate hydratase/2-oxohepta-3-ene-1,7-dioic acid hydratase in catechol pathway